MTVPYSQSDRFFLLFLNIVVNLFLALLVVVLLCACGSPDPWPGGGVIGGTQPPSGGMSTIGGGGGVQSISGSLGVAPTADASATLEARCGDGEAAPTESCDGNDLKGITCETLNAGTGQLRCFPDCKFDVSQCSKYYQPSAGGTPAIAGASGMVGTSGSGGVETPLQICTPNATESQACDECPTSTQTRQCLPDGSDWGVWSHCECGSNLPPGCEGQTQAPTWENSVGAILQSSCGRCHRQATSYSSFVSWRGGSTSWDATWTQSFGMHNLPADGLAVYNCWIASGLPEK